MPALPCRVFMGATFTDDSVLVSHNDVDPAALSAVVTPDTANDIGDRMILVPQALNSCRAIEAHDCARSSPVGSLICEQKSQTNSTGVLSLRLLNSPDYPARGSRLMAYVSSPQ